MALAVDVGGPGSVNSALTGGRTSVIEIALSDGRVANQGRMPCGREVMVKGALDSVGDAGTQDGTPKSGGIAHPVGTTNVPGVACGVHTLATTCGGPGGIAGHGVLGALDGVAASLHRSSPSTLAAASPGRLANITKHTGSNGNRVGRGRGPRGMAVFGHKSAGRNI